MGVIVGIHLALRVIDPTAMVAFFERLLGYRVVETVKSEEQRFDLYFLSGDSGERLELIHNYDERSYDAGSMVSHYGFDVGDLDRITANCRTHEIEIVEASEIDGRRFLYVKDPQGMYVEVSEIVAR